MSMAGGTIMNRTDTTYKRTDFTYGQLDRVLRSLGFTYRLLKEEPPARVYKHKESGAMIMLPMFPETDRVLDYHLIAARATLDNYGIAEPKVFDAELEEGRLSGAGDVAGFLVLQLLDFFGASSSGRPRRPGSDDV